MRGGVRVARDRPHSRAKSFCGSVGCGAARTLRGGAKTIYESTALRNAGGVGADPCPRCPRARPAHETTSWGRGGVPGRL